MVNDELALNPSENASYEFTPQENSVISGLTTAMTIVSVSWFLMGAVVAALGVLVVIKGSAFFSLPFLTGGAIMFYMGLDLWKASSSLKTITTSEGSDIQHLVEGVSHVGDYFKMVKYFFIVVFVIAVIGALFMF